MRKIGWLLAFCLVSFGAWASPVTFVMPGGEAYRLGETFSVEVMLDKSRYQQPDYRFVLHKKINGQFEKVTVQSWSETPHYTVVLNEDGFGPGEYEIKAMVRDGNKQPKWQIARRFAVSHASLADLCSSVVVSGLASSRVAGNSPVPSLSMACATTLGSARASGAKGKMDIDTLYSVSNGIDGKLSLVY